MLYDMVMDARNWQAVHGKTHLEQIDRRLDLLAGELRGIGMRRNGNGETLTTSKKFDIEFTKRNAPWIWFRDKVMPNLVTWFLIIILTGILYTSFGGTLP